MSPPLRHGFSNPISIQIELADHYTRMNNSKYSSKQRARRQRSKNCVARHLRLGLIVAVNLSTWTIADDDEIVPEEFSYEFQSTSGTEDSPADDATALSDSTIANIEAALDEYENALVKNDSDDGPVTISGQEFLRPGDTSAVDRYRSVRETEPNRVNGLSVWLDSGIGYDSTNAQRAESNYDSTVTWLEIGASYDRDFTLGDSRFFYGIDLGGSIFSLSSGPNGNSGGDTLLPHITPYFGIGGQKTIIRADLSYDKTDGQDYFSENQSRESLAQKSERSGVRVMAARLFDHSELATAFDYSIENFDGSSGLNDRTSWIGDVSWYYQPTALPKTSAGVGLRLGEYLTDQNPDISFVEPSLRSRYQIGPKTTFDGRVGYMFRDYEGENSTAASGDVTFALGGEWRASEQLDFRLESYRDYSSSLQSFGQAYDSTGFRLQCNYRLPFWKLNASTSGAYERAEYESTISNQSTDRSDDYWWVNSSLSRQFDTSRYFDTTISLFHNYRDNTSSSDEGDFSQSFTGVRVRLQF